MSARSVITRFGGIRPLAALLGHRSHTTVQGWFERDLIPAQRQREIIELGEREGVLVTADELVLGTRVAVCSACDARADHPSVASCTSPRCPLARGEQEAA